MTKSFTVPPRILYFIDGAVPTLDDQMDAEKLAPCRVVFRNARLVGDEGALETCDGVSGDATPARYLERYPNADEAIELFKSDRENAYKNLAEARDAATEKSLKRAAADAEGDAKRAKVKADKATTDADKKAAAAQKKADAAKNWNPNT